MTQAHSEFKQGEKLQSVWGTQDDEGDMYGAQIGVEGVIDIYVSQARGPMGFYEIAVAKREDAGDLVFPLHMLELIERAKP